MQKYFGALIPVIVMAHLAAGPAAGQANVNVNVAKPAATAAKAWTPSRTPDGKPDLQGIWNSSTITPLERPTELAGKEFLTAKEAADYAQSLVRTTNRDRRDGTAEDDLNRAYNDTWYDSGTIVKTMRTSLVVDPPDGRIPPYTPEAQKREAARAEERRRKGPEPGDSWEDRSLGERCITRGAPKLPGGYNNNFQIVQTPGYVAILQEMIHEVRMIPLDNRPHVDKSIRLWMGDSRGHWEGNTLVVDTTNYTDKIVSNAFNCCRGADANLHVIERFTRVSGDTIDYQYTVDDPTTYTRKWTVAVPLTKAEGPIYEYACHEGNYGMANLLSGARARERASERDESK